MMWTRYMSCFRIVLRWRHISLSGPGAEELLHLIRACQNSSFEKETQIKVGLDPISLRTSSSIWWWRAKLNVVWRASQRHLVVIHGLPLYLMASVVGSLHLLTQFINSHGLWLLFTTSQILESKNDLLVSFTTFLNFLPAFQASWYSILVDGLFTLIIPPLFGVSYNSCLLRIFVPHLID